FGAPTGSSTASTAAPDAASSLAALGEQPASPMPAATAAVAPSPRNARRFISKDPIFVPFLSRPHGQPSSHCRPCRSELLERKSLQGGREQKTTLAPARAAT